MDKQELVVMTKQELEDLIERVSYQAARKACSGLYDGLSKRFFCQWDKDIRRILYELEEMNR
ncbi:hypothetical protein [Sporosarcina highlanderae]|uniref:Uncharacterized protein n=1 Tax=Sporosarcina highlanderae TaxID=3035916 RepID=A0ABT8JQM6_9BACL|nr:hypothetical protein [Sporosarcina highlanderae]MDN4607369.1 hypothetical protein [Sporosarcina highlanderae]